MPTKGWPQRMQQLAATPTATPPTGYSDVYLDSTSRLVAKKPDATILPVSPGITFSFSQAGVLSVGTGVFRVYNDTGYTLTIRSVRASVGTAPTGAAVICDVNVDGTTIFATQANRPTIAISGFTNKTTGMSTTTIADGSYFTVDIDQIGSTIAGSNLTVQVLCS